MTRFMSVAAAVLCVTVSLAQTPRTWQLRGQTYHVVDEARLKAAGLPRRDVPDDRNAATLLMEAVRLMPAATGEQDALKTKATRGPWQAEYEPLMPWLQAADKALSLAREAADRPDCQFPLLATTPTPDVSSPAFLASVQMPHLAVLRDMSRAFVIRGQRFEQQGDLAAALKDCLTPAALGRRMTSGQDILISHLVGLACQNLGVAALRERLLTRDMDGQTLAWLAEELDRVAAIQPDPAGGFIYERHMARRFASPDGMAALADAYGTDGQVWRAFLTSRAARVILPDRLALAEVEEYFRPLTAEDGRRPWQSLADLSRRGREGELAGVSRWNVLGRTLLPALGSAYGRHVAAVAQLDSARLTVAIRRYGLARDAWPTSLDDLAPAFIKELPPDPLSGKPFGYKVLQTGWVLTAAADPALGLKVEPWECRLTPGRAKP